jgi:hypothetical protein
VKTILLVDDYILNYYHDVCIVIIIVFIMFMIDPFITSILNVQDAYASLICVHYSNDITVAGIRNCELLLNSHFHHTGSFSNLSRSMAPSSSDLFEDSEDTGIKEEVESNAEVDDSQDETTAAGQTNQTSPTSPSPPSSSDLFEDSTEAEPQDDVEGEGGINLQEESGTTAADDEELQENNNDNNIDSQLTNDT